ncbi:flagellar motor switch protein FliN [Nitrosomonas sp. JL21]|uniref:flagellar motor switch protein FliN n=1 Tax=Nitrosomonas sp. JL21 TaxID=153949 RepID=UPI0013707F24|nr:flagellar motor switch protein FliN [Nitrosomonas sp. JL21]MBL8497190.1 flagellar motor switch protein FliN [Nitrosomonas sp.]MXS76662.1 flagellar motor switch protein FliN [Nitrosomonas sp. JL21]
MSEPTANEQTELDDWAAAMAEQAAATQQDTTNVVNGSSETRSAQPAAAAVFHELSRDHVTHNGRQDIDLILDIPVQMTVELGRTKIAIKNLLQLAQGSVVELDGMAGEPMDVLINGCLIAQGEVVVVNDKFGIRLTDIITPSERIRKLNR